jgi:hypothetical protein
VNEQQEWEAVRAALRDAGLDPTDLARFVNAPNPAIRGLEPSTFDSQQAYPVLLAWLPRVHARPVVDTLASRIREIAHPRERQAERVGAGADRQVPRVAELAARGRDRPHHDNCGTRRRLAVLRRRERGQQSADARLCPLADQGG